jgi:hypothetical protein
MSIDVDLPIRLDHFAGGANLTEGEGSLAELLNNFDARPGGLHLPIVSPGRIDGPPGQLPPVESFGVLSYITFDGVAGAQKVHRTIKILGSFIDTPALHVHWTKSDDVDRSSETVRWRVFYSVFNGHGGLVPAETAIDLDGTYLDAGGASRAVYRTVDVPLVGFIPGYYLAVRVEKGTPASGTPVAEPGIVTVDLTMNAYVNRDGSPVL